MQLYEMTPDELNLVVEEVLGIVGDYRNPEVFWQIVQKGKALFVEQPFINTRGLKVASSIQAKDPKQEITIGAILAFLGKDIPFNAS